MDGLLEKSADGILAFDSESRVTVWNWAMECLSGIRWTETIGMTVSAVPPFCTDRDAGQTFRDVLAGQSGVMRDRLYATAKTGRRGVFDVHCAPLLGGSGRVVGGLALVRDVSEQRLLEEQLNGVQKLEAVGRFTNAVVHDFNSLLTVIKGHAQFLTAALPSGTPPRCDAERIIDAVDRGTGLIRQLLAFSRKQTPEPCLLDLTRLITDMMPLFEVLLDDQTKLRLRLDPGLWPIWADPGQMEQVLLNLVINAGDAIRDADKQGNTVTIETANIEVSAGANGREQDFDVGRHIMLTVSDTGCGMTGDVRERIFELFFTTKGAANGTGVGLSTVQGIVERHRGRIACESEIGRGTVFRIFLPYTELGRA